MLLLFSSTSLSSSSHVTHHHSTPPLNNNIESHRIQHGRLTNNSHHSPSGNNQVSKMLTHHSPSGNNHISRTLTHSNSSPLLYNTSSNGRNHYNTGTPSPRKTARSTLSYDSDGFQYTNQAYVFDSYTSNIAAATGEFPISMTQTATQPVNYAVNSMATPPPPGEYVTSVNPAVYSDTFPSYPDFHKQQVDDDVTYSPLVDHHQHNIAVMNTMVNHQQEFTAANNSMLPPPPPQALSYDSDVLNNTPVNPQLSMDQRQQGLHKEVVDDFPVYATVNKTKNKEIDESTGSSGPIGRDHQSPFVDYSGQNKGKNQESDSPIPLKSILKHKVTFKIPGEKTENV